MSAAMSEPSDAVVEPAREIIWRPSPERIAAAQLTHYRDWLAKTRGLEFAGYEDLWQWSVEHLEDFWQSIWDYFGIESPTPYVRVLDRHVMPGAKFFEGATLNYTAMVFRNARDGFVAPDRIAIVFRNESGDQPDIAWGELERRVAALAATLASAGVVAGDRVVAYLPNVPETVIAFLAVASLGAIWSVCAPDMGTGRRARPLSPDRAEDV